MFLSVNGTAQSYGTAEPLAAAERAAEESRGLGLWTRVDAVIARH
jgi:hypothetical protein